jgi:SNF2 family DNA or RNA helicase
MQSELFKPLSKPWQPHAYQKKAVKFLLEHAASALFLDPGLGKTSVTLAAIKLLKQKKVLNKVLLIAPLRVCYSVWPKETDKWTDFGGLKVAVLHGPRKDEALKSDADIYVINHEGLDWLTQVKKVKTVSAKTGRVTTKMVVDLRRFKAFGFDTLVVDELSKFKHSSSGRFKVLKEVLDTFRRRWGLTGSPASNGLMDLFGQCYILDQGRTLGQYVSHYRMKYFVPSHDGFSWNIREGAEDEIYERISPLALRMAADDYLDMPALIENNIRVDLPDKVMDMYTTLEDDLIAKLDAKVIVASTAAAASIKCRQVANGGIYLDPEVQALVKLPKSSREWVNLHTEKVDALADLIDELQGSPLLVAYDFAHDLDRLQEKLGQEVPYIGGGISAKRSAELEQLWNAGKLPVLLGHPQAMAHGLNLQEMGSHVCWHSLTWDYELYDQFIRRVLRQGNKSKKVFVHHILARGTIDEVVLSALKSKRRGQNALFDALKKLSKGQK